MHTFNKDAMKSRSEYIFYSVGFYSEMRDDWVDIEGDVFGLSKYKDGETTKKGDCWKNLREFGTFNYYYAKSLCNDLNKLLKNGTLLSNKYLENKYEKEKIREFKVFKKHGIFEVECM